MSNQEGAAALPPLLPDRRSGAHCASLAAAICPLLGQLPTTTLSAIMQRVQQRYFRRGDALARSGETATCLFVIVEGVMSACIPGQGGGAPTRILQRGDLCCELALFGDMPQSADVRAITNGTLLALDGRDVKQAIRQDTEFSARVIRHLCGQTRSFELQMQANQARRASARLAGLLLALVSLRNPPAVRISQATLGELIGASRETVSRMLTDWRRAGLIDVVRGAVVPQDMERLREMAAASRTTNA